MLDVANVVKRSAATERFDTVVFFGPDEESIVQTKKRIPGANGFPGNFIEVVLLEDPEEELLANDADPLDSPEDEKDEAQVRRLQRLKSLKRGFIKQFPFDVINLDLEEFLFKPKDQLPGKVVNAFRNVFRWQRRPLPREHGPDKPLDGFSLMFTTQIGPPDITADCSDMLERYLRENMQQDNRLGPLLMARSGIDNAAQLKGEQFDLFFKLAMPKVLAGILLEEDWYVEPDGGIQIFEFRRESDDGPYQMLHLVMDVKRQHPPRELRPPVGGAGQQISDDAITAYREVALKLFRDPERVVVLADLNEAELNKNLAHIKARRKKYHSEDDL